MAAILLCATVAMTVVTMSVDAWRIRFFNMIKEAEQKYTSVEMVENMYILSNSDIPESWRGYYYPEALPEGYELDEATINGDVGIMIFSSGNLDKIIFYQGAISGKTIEVEVKGHEGLLVEKEDLNILMWQDNINMYYIHGNIDKLMLLKMADNVRMK